MQQSTYHCVVEGDAADVLVKSLTPLGGGLGLVHPDQFGQQGKQNWVVVGQYIQIHFAQSVRMRAHISEGRAQTMFARTALRDEHLKAGGFLEQSCASHS